MRSDELREQIEALRSEVRALGDSFINLRQDEVRRVFAEQVRPVLTERVDRALLEIPSAQMGGGDRKAFRAAVTVWLEEALGALESDDREALPRFLEANRGRSVVRQWGFSALDELMGGLEAQLLSYHRSYDAVLKPSPSTKATREAPRTKELDPVAAEEVLGPLSNALRVGVLQRLSQQDDGLASLSRATGLQKGHLQFHLKVLLDAHYIVQDRHSRMYAITARGKRALNGLTVLVDSVGR